MTAILGGGISGLSAAYYLLKARSHKLTIIESSAVVGGWIRSIADPVNGFLFEKGPRTVRPGGPQGLNTLKLVEELDLSDKLLYVPRSHPSAKNRLIYVDKKLHTLPSNVSSLFKNVSPFSKPLVLSAITDLTAPRSGTEDESIYSFVERRFGKEIAEYAISSMICGICAGDAKEISVKFLLSTQFQWEKTYGSVLMGFVNSLIFAKSDSTISNVIENSHLAKRSCNEKWSVWYLRGGLQQLPDTLSKVLQQKGVAIELNSLCTKLIFDKNNHVYCLTEDPKGPTLTRQFDHIICSLPATKLANLVAEQHPNLSRELSEINNVTVVVVNIAYRGSHLKYNAFGFLAPPREKLPILGVIFDSCNLDYKNWTVLTVMMGGRWYDDYFDSSDSEDKILGTALKYVSSILEINQHPDHTHVSVLKDCIPQYTVGHSARVDKAMAYIKEHRLPLTLIGSSYYGVGINDVIYTAKKAVSQMNKY